MKKILSFLLVLSVGITVVMAQPQKMTYQAVVRNNNNELIVNQQVGVRVSILEDSVNGPIIYRETHTPTTNFNGLITMMIGEGIHPYTYTLDDVKWGKHTHYMSIEIDPAGGTNYTIFGTQQMVTVPYAFYSESAKYVDTANYAANALHADTAYYLAGFTNSDTALFAYNADTAVYANAANTSNMSNAANYADSARVANVTNIAFIANYADSARVANTSNTALSANYADSTRISNTALSTNYATLAGSATVAASATYADSTQVADFAHNANAANTAILTTYSTYADTAYFLMNAQNSDTAKFAYNSDTATYAYGSGTASYANSANMSNYADSARVANASNTALSANYADSTRISGTAISANYATMAGSATTATSATYADSTQVADYAHNSDTTVYSNMANMSNIANYADSARISTSAISATYADTADYNKLLNKPVGMNKGDILYWETNDNTWHIVPVGNIGETLTLDSNYIPQWHAGNTVNLPTLTTDSVVNVTTTTASVYSNIISDGGSAFVFSGICWSTLPNPTTTDMHTLDGLSKTSITSYMTGLTMGTIYHVRAYAIGSAGTAYGNEITFRTQTYPTVSTDAVSNISVTTAVSGGDVTDDGGAPITARGICWSITPMPTIADSHTSDGIGAGAFASSLTTLARYTKYYVRAYATNYIGTSYGDTVSFTTLADFPTVTTAAVGSITSVTAVVGGNVTDDGDATVTARGICYNTTGNPTIADNTLPIGSGTGSFSATLSGLTASTTYYICAYATNSIGTSYGSTISFTTLAPWTCGISTITDYDNNVYNTIQLGTQCWMRDNLRTTHYSNGDGITIVTSGTSASVAYCYHANNDASNDALYGLIYNWTAVMHGATSTSANPSGVQGICPTGWHVPSDAEWTDLSNYVSSQSGFWCGGESTYTAKSLASTIGWSSSSNTCSVGLTPEDNNATGFNAMPAGRYTSSFSDFGSVAWYWSASEYSGAGSLLTALKNGLAYIFRDHTSTNAWARSVRCVKD